MNPFESDEVASWATDVVRRYESSRGGLLAIKSLAQEIRFPHVKSGGTTYEIGEICTVARLTIIEQADKIDQLEARLSQLERAMHRKGCPTCNPLPEVAKAPWAFREEGGVRTWIHEVVDGEISVRTEVVETVPEAQQSEQEAQSQPSPGVSPIGAGSSSHACSELVGSGETGSPGVPGHEPYSFLAPGADL